MNSGFCKKTIKGSKEAKEGTNKIKNEIKNQLDISEAFVFISKNEKTGAFMGTGNPVDLLMLFGKFAKHLMKSSDFYDADMLKSVIDMESGKELKVNSKADIKQLKKILDDLDKLMEDE